MKIGVMGGTFDPVHRGHLAVANEARHCLALDEILFLPAGNPYFKETLVISPAEQRLAMLKLAIRNAPYFKISLLEIERPGPSYSVESMFSLKSQLGPAAELFFILGWDSLINLYRWFEAGRLIRLCRIVAAPRPGYAQPDLKELEKELPGIAARAILLDKPCLDISSTTIRDYVRRGLPIDSLVPRAVARYIRKNGLYLNQPVA